MVYSRKPRARKTFGKKKTYARKSMGKSFASKVLSVVKKVAETKSHIVSGAEVGFSSLASPTALNNVVLNFIGQGDTISTRSGNKISPSFLNVRGNIHLATDSVTQWVRLLVLEHDVAEDFTVDGLETDLATFSPPGADITAINGRINTTKFKVLAQKTIRLGHTQGYYSSQMFNMNIKLKGNMYFEQASNVPQKRRLSFVFYNRRCDNDEILGTVAEMSYNCKFYYTDM